MVNQEPFIQHVSKDQTNVPTTAIEATAAPVPAGKRFVVEHISGTVAISNGHPLDRVFAETGIGGQRVYLPKHFESSTACAIVSSHPAPGGDNDCINLAPQNISFVPAIF